MSVTGKSIIGKTIGATLMAVAGASLMVDQSGTVAAGLGAKSLALIGASAAAISGNLAHEAYNKVADKYGPPIFDRYPDIDRNHHIIIALRHSHLDALTSVLRRFDGSRRSDPDEARRYEAERVSALLKSVLSR